jgi:hypothetical protein
LVSIERLNKQQSKARASRKDVSKLQSRVVPLPGRPCSARPPFDRSCSRDYSVHFIFGFYAAKLYPRSVPGAWRAESRGSLRGDVHILCSLGTTAFPACGRGGTGIGSHPQWNFRTRYSAAWNVALTSSSPPESNCFFMTRTSETNRSGARIARPGAWR